MTFDEVLGQVQDLLQREQRVSYRGLKRRFALDDEYLEDLKEELIGAKRIAADENGRFLVWAGGEDAVTEASASAASTPPSAQAQSAASVQTALTGERRQLTVMFCDLVGSTALSEQLDPEDLRAIVRTYQDACRQVIECYDGHIAQYLGDGILVYFGYPAAHEDDAIRGVRVGLDILAALPTLELAQPIQVRISIHTGPVVIGAVGSGDHTEQLALGETPNIAARIQGKAEASTVVISRDTYRLVRGFFACEDLGPQELKGLSAPLRLYQVTGEGEAQTQFEVSVQQGLTPFIGREEEVELLVRRWERAKAGEGQVVLLSGEAGIGKSRLVQVLRDQSATEDYFSTVFRCATFYQNSALYPVVDQLQRVLQFGKDDSPTAKLTTLSQALELVEMTDIANISLFASLLSIPLPDKYPPLQLSPQKQKEHTLHALVTWLQKLSTQQPVRVAFEDLHWADPSTLEFLGLLLDLVPTARMLVLLTFRPEFTPPWSSQAHFLSMHLSPLSPRRIAEVVERVAGKPLPHDIVQQLITKSDGVPLYIEEMTKNLLESGLLTETDGQYALTGPLPHMAIPSSLQDSFAARLDRLAPVRELAQIGAVLGRKFAYDLIHAVSPMDGTKLQDGLGQLSNAEILFQRGVPPDATYTFKHALLQDAAYESLLKSQRQRFHAQTAQVLETQFPETTEPRPELVAHHYTEAGLQEQAIPYWQRAGQQAVQRSANEEAISHLSQGLELLKTLPDTVERSQQELSLQIALGAVLIATKGFASPAARQAYARARELCEQLGDTPQLFPVLFGLCTVYTVGGEHKTAHGLAEQLLSLAHRQQAPGFSLTAHLAFGMTSFFLGEPAVAREPLEQAIALYDPQRDNPQVSGSAQDLGVMCRVCLALALWPLGYPDQALKRVQEALTLARELAHPYSLAYAMSFAARLHQWRREGQQTHEQAEAAIALSTDQGFALYLALGTMLRGWALVEQGQEEEGMAQLRQGVTGWRATGAEVFTPYYLAVLGETYGRGGQAGEGLTILGEALAIANKNEERFYEAELYRLKGELLRAREGKKQKPKGKNEEVSEAEAFFQKAIDIARRQSAKLLELRAATSLARLWQQNGKQQEARELLAPVYNWFTEGFETKDLQEAKELLEELL